ncbi:MAG: hypothetical protein HZA15_10545 [Nitrospirae bacterium]|nr:hypothetical protein [Nitrospirota bacterium]
MKHYITPNIPKAAFIKHRTRRIPKIKIENGRGLMEFPTTEDVVAAIESLRDPTTTVIFADYQECVASIKDQLFNTKINKGD